MLIILCVSMCVCAHHYCVFLYSAGSAFLCIHYNNGPTNCELAQCDMNYCHHHDHHHYQWCNNRHLWYVSFTITSWLLCTCNILLLMVFNAFEINQSNMIFLFQTFAIFRPSFPGGRNLDIQSSPNWIVWNQPARSPVAQLAYLEGTRRAFTWLSSYLILRVNQGLDIYWINLVSFCDIMEIFIVIEIATTKCAPLSSNHRLSRVLAIKLVLATEPLFNRSLFQKINIGVHAIKAISLH